MGTFLLTSNHSVIYVFLVGRRSSKEMGEGVRRKSLGYRESAAVNILCRSGTLTGFEILTRTICTQAHSEVGS